MLLVKNICNSENGEMCMIVWDVDIITRLRYNNCGREVIKLNEQFKKAVKASKMSPYRLSKYSGVPYTTISELLTEKKDINKRAADTVVRLAKAMDLEVSDIMNPIYVLDGVSGRHNGVSYKWKRKNDHMSLLAKSKKWTETIDIEYTFQKFNERKKYDLIAGLYIDPILQQKKLEEYAAEKRREN